MTDRELTAERWGLDEPGGSRDLRARPAPDEVVNHSPPGITGPCVTGTSVFRHSYIDPSGNVVIDPGFIEADEFDEGRARGRAADDGRALLIDRSGRPQTSERYDFILPFTGGVARVNVGGQLVGGNPKGGRWGLIDRTGGVVLAPRPFDFMLSVDDGCATFGVDGKCGFTDGRGTIVVEPTYSYMTWHSEGLAVAATPSGDGYVDRSGKMVIAPRFQEATVFNGGVARVKVEGRWGLIDRSGAFVHAPTYDRLGKLVDGACWAVAGGRCYVLDAKGVVGDAAFDEIRQAFQSGVWPVRRGNAWGFLRPDGRLIGMGWENAVSFSEGRGGVARGGKWGFVDLEGKVVVSPRYADLNGFTDGRAAVKADDGWTFIDERGRELGIRGLGQPHVFRGGLCAVRVGREWGYIDREGSMVIPPQFAAAGRFAEGLAAVLAPPPKPTRPFPAQPEVHTLPPGGLSHPLFAHGDRHSHLIAIVGFSRALNGRESAVRDAILAAWEATVDVEGPLYTEDKFVADDRLYLRVQNLADPRAELSLLMAELTAARLPIGETLFGRWGQPPNEKVMRAVGDPNAPHDRIQSAFADFESYWRAIWDPSGPIPASENIHYLEGGFQTRDRSLVLEERHTMLWYPDVRVCMGALGGSGETVLSTDARTLTLARALDSALERRFAVTWAPAGRRPTIPEPITRNGDPGLETIEYRGRRGYSFAVPCDQLLHWFSASRCRWREQELLDAVREVVLAQELAPVILWQRFQQQIPMTPIGTPDVLVVNLWERV